MATLPLRPEYGQCEVSAAKYCGFLAVEFIAWRSGPHWMTLRMREISTGWHNLVISPAYLEDQFASEIALPLLC